MYFQKLINNVLRTAQNWGGGLTPLKIIFQKFGGLAPPPPSLQVGNPMATD